MSKNLCLSNQYLLQTKFEGISCDKYLGYNNLICAIARNLQTIDLFLRNN